MKSNMEPDDVNEFYADYGTLHHDINEDIANKKIYTLEEAFRIYDSRFPSCNLPDNIRPDYYKQGRQAIENKFNELQNLDIVGVEKEFKVPIDFTIPPLYGFIDLIYRDEKGRLIVRDYKTSKVYGKTELDKQYQPFFYSMGCKHLFGELPFAFEFDFVRFNEKKTIIINDRFIQLWMIKTKGSWNQMKAEPYEGKYNPFFCANFCENHTICPLFMRKNGF